MKRVIFFPNDKTQKRKTHVFRVRNEHNKRYFIMYIFHFSIFRVYHVVSHCSWVKEFHERRLLIVTLWSFHFLCPQSKVRENALIFLQVSKTLPTLAFGIQIEPILVKIPASQLDAVTIATKLIDSTKHSFFLNKFVCLILYNKLLNYRRLSHGKNNVINKSLAENWPTLIIKTYCNFIRVM